MSIFGWSYPPGAEHDPEAPWNQDDLPSECPTCGASNEGCDDDVFPYCCAGCLPDDEIV